MSQSRTPRKPITPPPSADDLRPHEPLTGIKGVAARAYIRRIPHVAGVVLLAAGFASAGLTVFRGDGNVPRDARFEDVATVAQAEHKTVTTAPSILLVPPPTLLEKEEQPPSAAEGKNTSSETITAPMPDNADTPPAVPVVEARKADLPAVPGVGADMQSVDMGELSSAVDALGIRTEQLEKQLPTRAEEPEAAREKTPETEQPTKVEPAPASMPAMSAEDAGVHERLRARLEEAEAKGDENTVKSAKAELEMFEATLNTLIEFRIVDRRGEKPGFWRTRVGDDATKQFFVVVEAVVDGKAVNWAVRDADSGKVVLGPKFGLRVDEKTFAELSEDKKDDGRIDRMAVGLKPVGRITPVWSIKTDGETITGF